MKLDPDNVTRKVTVMYKVPQKTQGEDYKSSPFKYAPRSVRGLALLMTVEEKDQIESIDLESVRSQLKTKDSSDIPNVENKVCKKEKVSTKLKENTKVSPTPETFKTSSGRKSIKPNYYQAPA